MAEPNNVKSIFLAASEKPLAERNAFLDQATGGDAALRARVEALLKAHDNPDSFLKDPAAEFGATIEVSPDVPPLAERAGTLIGPYKLLQQIGEGGMGVVFMADQSEPIQRTVALKIIKPGMDTRQVIARFEAERQALAMMDHPNIARVIDAGTTDTGRPYFVMDLVKGVPITTYCNQQHLPIRARLELMSAVCHAVQHAHQKGIIHRDLKPSNVLVAEYDGKPVPKIIDFGVAKATAQRLTERTMFTEYGQLIGTFEYMSPEQARFNQLDIDTRSDIYSLGVLAYELLTGSTPLEKERLRAAAFDEILRLISEEEPPRPSTRLGSSQTLPSISAQRRIEPEKLKKLVQGELDWIVMKCLEKDRNRRYETASSLAADIQHYLSDEPVTARPASSLYRFRKTVRRNKIVFAAAGAVIAAITLGLGVSTWMFFQERAARQRAFAAEQAAKTEANKNQQVAQFLTAMLQGVGPSVAMGRDTKMLREILDKTADRVGRDLKDQPDVEADMCNTLGAVYLELGEYPKAEAMHREALAIRKKRLGDEHPDVATSLNNLADVLDREGNFSEAEAMHREALAIQRKLLGDEHLDVATSLHGLAGVLSDEAKLAEAETLFREALAMRKKLLGNDHPDVALTLHDLAVTLGNEGKREESEMIFREALAIQRKLLVDEDPNLALTLHDLAVTLANQGKLAEAETMLREVLTMRKKLLGNEHPDVAYSLDALAVLLANEDKLAEAETMHREVLTMRKKLLGNEHPDVAFSLNALAITLAREEKLAEAETMYRELLVTQKKRLGDEHPEVAASLSSLARVLEREGKLDEAETMRREALAVSRKLPGDEQLDAAASLSNLARALEREGKLAPAETMHREALVLFRKLRGNEHPDVAASLNNLAGVQAREGNLAGAEDSYKQAFDICKTLLRHDPNDTKSQRALENAWRGVATLRGLGGDWQAAVKAFASAKEQDPGDAYAYYYLAVSHLAADDTVAYRTVCNEMLGRFGNTTNPYVADRVGYSCVPAPHAVDDTSSLISVAKLGATIWNGNDRLAGAALYRAGKFRDALEQFQASGRKGFEFEAWDCAFLAMIQHHLGNGADATRRLEEARQKKDAAEFWWEKLEVDRLIREADDLISRQEQEVAQPR